MFSKLRVWLSSVLSAQNNTLDNVDENFNSILMVAAGAEKIRIEKVREDLLAGPLFTAAIKYLGESIAKYKDATVYISHETMYRLNGNRYLSEEEFKIFKDEFCKKCRAQGLTVESQKHSDYDGLIINLNSIKRKLKLELK